MSEGGITFSEMTALCGAEAARIEMTQVRLVESGLRSTADPGQLRNMRVYESIIHLIDLVRGDDVILNRLRRKTAPMSEKKANARQGAGAPP